MLERLGCRLICGMRNNELDEAKCSVPHLLNVAAGDGFPRTTLFTNRSATIIGLNVPGSSEPRVLRIRCSIWGMKSSLVT